MSLYLIKFVLSAYIPEKKVCKALCAIFYLFIIFSSSAVLFLFFLFRSKSFVSTTKIQLFLRVLYRRPQNNNKNYVQDNAGKTTKNRLKVLNTKNECAWNKRKWCSFMYEKLYFSKIKQKKKNK